MIKWPKLYFLDTDMAPYLSKWSSPDALEAGSNVGRHPGNVGRA